MSESHFSGVDYLDLDFDPPTSEQVEADLKVCFDRGYMRPETAYLLDLLFKTYVMELPESDLDDMGEALMFTLTHDYPGGPVEETETPVIDVQVTAVDSAIGGTPIACSV